MARDTNQLTLSFLDTTSLSAGGLTLDAGYNRPRTPSSPQEPTDDESALVSPSPSAIPARNFHLTGDRRSRARLESPRRRQSRQHALGAPNRRGKTQRHPR